MMFVTRRLSHGIAMLLVCALIAASAPIAEAKPLTPEKVHEKLIKRGLGNWVGVELQNGTAFTGRIVSIDDQSFSLQLHNDPQVTAVFYNDVVCLQTGISHGAFWAITAGGMGAAVAFALIARHEFVENEPKLPSQPTQPLFP
jgi:hypothetical protein